MPPSAARPDLEHVARRHPDVYLPSMPDTQLLLDAVNALDLTPAPTVCLEVACGSAPLAAQLALRLGSSAATLATDVSVSAMAAATETAQCNGVSLQIVRMDVVEALRPGLVDVLIWLVLVGVTRSAALIPCLEVPCP